MKEAPCTRCCVQCREGDVGLPGGKCKLEVHWELQTQLHKLTCIISIIPPLSSFFTFVRSSLCYSCLQYIQGRQFVGLSVVPAPVSRHSGSLLQYQCNSRLCDIIQCQKLNNLTKRTVVLWTPFLQSLALNFLTLTTNQKMIVTQIDLICTNGNYFTIATPSSL